MADDRETLKRIQAALRTLDKDLSEAIRRELPAPTTPVEHRLQALVDAYKALQVGDYLSGLALFEPQPDVLAFALEQKGRWHAYANSDSARNDGDPEVGTLSFWWAECDFTIHRITKEGRCVSNEEWDDIRAARLRRDAESRADAAHAAGANDLVTVQEAVPEPQGEAIPPAPETVETYNPWVEAMDRYHSDQDDAPAAEPETFATPADAGWKA